MEWEAGDAKRSRAAGGGAARQRRGADGAGGAAHVARKADGTLPYGGVPR